MLTKYEQKDLKMIELILERGKLKDAKDAIARWLVKAGDNKEARERRAEAANRTLARFIPAGGGYGGVKPDRRS